MKNGRLQIKDMDQAAILEGMKAKPLWCAFPDQHNGIQQLFPAGTPLKLVLGTMQSLIKKGKIDGCSCGCRGDFHIL